MNIYMNNIEKNNSTLSISSHSIKDCNDVVKYMRELKIPCLVSSNKSIIRSNGKHIIENGCQIKMVSHDSEVIDTNFWIKTKNKFGLSCAHLEVEGKFKGCIYDYLRSSNCPG
jgi:hypothetical protein